MRIYDDRFPSMQTNPKMRRFDKLMNKYMRKVALANTQSADVYVDGHVDVLNILAYRDKLNRKGHI